MRDRQPVQQAGDLAPGQRVIRLRGPRQRPAAAPLPTSGDEATRRDRRPAAQKEFGQGLAIVLRGFRAMLAEPSPLTREQT